MTSPWTDDLMPSGGGPQIPRARSAPGRAGRSGAIAVLVVVVVLGLLAIPALSLGRGGKQFWPDHWDPRVGPIAERDAQTRGLAFDHPVAIRFLAEADFKKLAGGEGGVDAAEGREIAREAATFRALGFIDGDVDLFDVTKQAGEAGALAFYDFDKKEIVVRGTTFNYSLRATLAHELTHALQDQNFDLRQIEHQASEDDAHHGGSAGAMLALIEGDANRIEDSYVKALSAAQKKEYDREQAAQGRAYDKATVGVPPFVELLFGAPYELGPQTIRVLVAEGGNGAVDAALTGPTPTSADFVQAGLVAPPPANLPAPILTPDEKAEGPGEAFGAFELYVMLATRDDPAAALSAADAILGGRAQGLRRNGTYCYRATLATRDAAAATFVESSLTRWATKATRPAVSRVGTNVTFTACDPGSKAAGASKERVEAAVLLLAGRSEIAAGVAEGGAPPAAARCVARLFALSPGALDTLQRAGGGELPPDEEARLRAQVQQQALTCRDNANAGLL
jgi:hypothetical protein